ncbi:hypothetical protein WMY93_029568 [Mugilogobius chulae]|uniref:Uncharacterized protein n=1 Tax=Mugilogobius chulae TaxID=88201 RepID=A0AAW0MT46_9GOBI
MTLRQAGSEECLSCTEDCLHLKPLSELLLQRMAKQGFDSYITSTTFLTHGRFVSLGVLEEVVVKFAAPLSNSKSDWSELDRQSLQQRWLASVSERHVAWLHTHAQPQCQPVPALKWQWHSKIMKNDDEAKEGTKSIPASPLLPPQGPSTLPGDVAPCQTRGLHLILRLCVFASAH